MKTRIALLIRRTESYFKGTIDLSKITRHALTVEDLIQTTWGCKVRYLEFRRGLRFVAERSLKDFDWVIPWSDQEKVKALPPGTWLVPVDEDDWLHPDLTHLLKQTIFPAQAEVVTWGVQRKEADGTILGQSKFIESCGYALRLPCDWPLITNHMLIKEQVTSEKIFHISKVLAVRNETPASVGFLLKEGSPKRALEGAILGWKATEKKIYRWAQPQYHRYMKLLESVRKDFK